MANQHKRYIGSTEPQARKVLKKIQKSQSKPKTKMKDTGGKTTAKTIVPRLTKEQKTKSLAAARKRAAARPTVKKKATAKPKRKSYGRKMK